METKNNYVLALGMLVIGGLLGYVLASNMIKPAPLAQMSNSSAHMMPNGTMMQNDGGMQGMMDDMSAGLSGKTGDDFDRTFLTEMIVHHQGAVQMAQQVLATSKRPELLELANNIIAAQTTEIQMMKDWQKQWFNQ